jgi:hypothetical protein
VLHGVGVGVAATGWLGRSSWLTAREEATAPTAAIAAATRNNEQKIRRHRDGVNVNVEFELVIIELPVRLDWLVVNRRRIPTTRAVAIVEQNRRFLIIWLSFIGLAFFDSSSLRTQFWPFTGVLPQFRQKLTRKVVEAALPTVRR